MYLSKQEPNQLEARTRTGQFYRPPTAPILSPSEKTALLKKFKLLRRYRFGGLDCLAEYEYDEGLGKFKLKKILKKVTKAVITPVAKVTKKAITIAAASTILISPKMAQKITGVKLSDKEIRNIKRAQKAGLSVAALVAAPYMAAGALKLGAGAAKLAPMVFSKWVSPINNMRKAAGKVPLSLANIGQKMGLLKKRTPAMTDEQAFEQAAGSEQELVDNVSQASQAINAGLDIPASAKKYAQDFFNGSVEDFMEAGRNALRGSVGEQQEAAAEVMQADAELKAEQAPKLAGMGLPVILGLGLAAVAAFKRK